MSWYEALAILVAGMGAGTINAVVGSGTLITFPTLVALGYPPVVANISNNLGLVPGGVASTIGYREELRGQGRRLRLLAPASLLGGAAGAALLLTLPSSAFEAIVPVLIVVALVLVVLQTRIQRAMAARRERRGEPDEHLSAGRRVAMVGGTFAAGTYGGYFGAAQGILLIGLLGALLPEPIQRLNAAKNLLTAGVNFLAAVIFAVFAFDDLDWAVVGLIAVGSTIGGTLGARYGRRLPPTVLRGIIVAVSLVALARLLLS